MLQRERDLAAGLNTAGFVSGYRGSPLGPLDQGLWKAQGASRRTSRPPSSPGSTRTWRRPPLWGSQQVGLFPGARYDGVFGLWYGKGPGVDRCGDVFRHANAAGSARYGGVLVVAGDDHAAKSSTLPHQTEHIFKAVLMPVLYPANIQEYIEYGLHGWALSRYSGCWVAFKALADTVETSASVNVDPAAVDIVLPQDFALPPDGLNIRWPDPPLEQEKRLLNLKLYAALAYCRANHLDCLVIDSPQPRLGILTAGKSYLDVRQALDELGIDEALAAQIGIRLYKVGMVWPLEPEGVRRFAEGPGGNPGRRGKAATARIPAQGGALQLARRRAPAGDRQIRRKRRVDRGRRGRLPGARRLAAAGHRRTAGGDDCQGDRGPHRPLLHLAGDSCPARPDRPEAEGQPDAAGAWPSASRISVPAARTTPQPRCRKARGRWPGSAATTW